MSGESTQFNSQQSPPVSPYTNGTPTSPTIPSEDSSKVPLTGSFADEPHQPHSSASPLSSSPKQAKLAPVVEQDQESTEVDGQNAHPASAPAPVQPATQYVYIQPQPAPPSGIGRSPSQYIAVPVDQVMNGTQYVYVQPVQMQPGQPGHPGQTVQAVEPKQQLAQEKAAVGNGNVPAQTQYVAVPANSAGQPPAADPAVPASGYQADGYGYVRQVNADGTDDTPYYAISIFFPWLGVLLKYGCDERVAIAAGLTVFFLVPGILYAFLIIAHPERDPFRQSYKKDIDKTWGQSASANAGQPAEIVGP